MNELVNIKETKINNEVIPTISARDLWEKLEVKRNFPTWVKSQIEQFNEGFDYVRVAQKGATKGGVQDMIEYHLTLNCAEHIALMSRTQKGKEVRQYFIDVESAWRTGKQDYKKLRDKSKEVRNHFTECLKEHGYKKPHHYIQTTKQMKETLGIVNKKDEMTPTELKKILASETLAELKIEAMNASGYHEVNPVCVETSRMVENTIKPTPLVKSA